jgi:transcriptional regulator with XRE-family HTH domain
VLGVHRTYMGAVERGQRNLTLQSLERIAGKIGVEATDLLIVRH